MEEHKHWWIRIRNDDSERFYVVRLKAEPETIIGHLGLTHIDWRSRNAEFGRFLIWPENMRGKGYGLDSLSLILYHAFKHLGLVHIYAYTTENHNDALKSYRNVGFTREGILRKHKLINGKLTDIVILGILSNEYRMQHSQPSF